MFKNFMCLYNCIITFLFVLIITISGCQKSEYMAPVVYKGHDSEEKLLLNKNKIIIVEEGYTLYSIARKEGVSVRTIIQINNLKPPFILHSGDELIIPSALIHTVEKGESLWKISECYGIDIITLINANNIQNKTLNIGEKLIIPSRNTSSNKKCNYLDNVITDKKLDSKNIKDSKKDNKTSVVTDKKYIWPVNGELLSKFGIQEKGMRNDGVNIIANKGQPVLATQDGEVVYSGNAIEAFGNLILIKHNNNRTSAYAHVDNVEVVKGQLVKKGQQIAKVSNTGKVNRPQLHFEIRDNSGPIDPLKLLPSKKL